MSVTSSEMLHAPLTVGEVLDLGDPTIGCVRDGHAEANARAGAAAHRLQFIRPNKDVFRVCEIAGLDTLLPFETEEAINRNV